MLRAQANSAFSTSVTSVSNLEFLIVWVMNATRVVQKTSVTTPSVGLYVVWGMACFGVVTDVL